MIFKRRKQIDKKLWRELLRELRRQRGANSFRGRQTAYPQRGEIRLEIEARGASAPAGWVSLFVGKDPGETRCVHPVQRRALTEFDDLAAFVEAALALCRQGKPYIRTHENKTEYK